MKRFARIWPYLVPGVLAVLVVRYEAQRGTARAEVQRLTTLSDSLARVTARVDTLYSVDTATFTRWRTVRDTLRDSLTITDTVEVIRFIAVQDSTIAACSAALLTCDERVALRDQRLAIVSDSLPRAVATEWRGKVTRERKRGLCAVAGAVGGGAVSGENAALGAGLGALGGWLLC